MPRKTGSGASPKVIRTVTVALTMRCPAETVDLLIRNGWLEMKYGGDQPLIVVTPELVALASKISCEGIA
jgi:hypothetical protein